MWANLVMHFEKSKEKRLEEFRDVLCADPPLPAAGISSEWAFRAEYLLEPAGWQALWKVNRQTCERFSIKFPNYVLVTVGFVVYVDLAAFVSVDCVAGDISIPKDHHVPLIELYPTKEQENSALDFERTAEFIDQLRFFYNHLWQPWDLDEMDEGDWPTKYLKSRLNLYYEMNQITFPQKLASRVYYKIQEAHRLYKRKKELEEFLNEGEMEGKDFDSNIFSPSIQSHGYELFLLHIKLNPLKTELQLLENPSMRTLVVTQFFQKEEANSKRFNTIAVWNGGSIDAFEKYINKCKAIVRQSDKIGSAPSLVAAIDQASSGQKILLHPGVHHMSCSVDVNISIIGTGNEVCISQEESTCTLINAHSSHFNLKEVSLDANNVEIGILVPRRAEVHLSKCSIVGQNKRETVGVVVLPGGSVAIDSCVLSDLYIGIFCHAGAKVSISQTVIENCQYGVKMSEGVIFTKKDGSIINCKEAGFLMMRDGKEKQSGSIASLDREENVHLKNVCLVGNQSDVIFQSSSLQSIILD